MAAVDQLYSAVGQRIRKAREECKLTQDKLADAVGLTRTSITNIERGRQKLPLRTLYDIAIALTVEPSSLLPSLTDSMQLRGLEQKLPTDLSAAERDWIRSVVLAPDKES